MLGLILRIGSSLVNYPSMNWKNDARMSIPAARLLVGKGFTLEDAAGPTAYRPPLYILWLSVLYKIFGTYAEFGPSLVQAIVSAGNVILVFLLAKNIWKREDLATASALLLAIHPYTIYHDVALYHTFLSTGLLLGGLLFLFKGYERSSWLFFFLSGLFFGGCVLITSVIVPFLGLLILMGTFFWQETAKHRLFYVGSFILGLSVLWGPWIVRNALTFHAFIPLTTESGVTLWMGNNPESAWRLKERTHEASPVPVGTRFNLPQYYYGCTQATACQGGISEYQENRELTQLATGWIKQHPVEFIHLTQWRFLGIWSPWLTPAKNFGTSIFLNFLIKYGYFAWNIMLFFTGAVGAGIAWREKRVFSLITILFLALSGTGSYALFLYYTKYRIPFEATLLPFCGAGLFFILHKIYTRFILKTSLVLDPRSMPAKTAEPK